MASKPGGHWQPLSSFEYTLRPIIPDSSNRYTKSSSVIVSSQTIRPGGFLQPCESEPAYLPPRWSAHVHPEGQLYFSRHAPLRVVTESHLYSTQTLYKIISCIKRVEELLSRERITITDRMELFLELGSDECLYYLVDDSSRTVFWPEAVDTESVGLPDSVSASHLRNALEVQYWNHVEHFPMHFGGLPSHLVDDLICTFSHGLADHLTSNVSTFVHPREECEAYLRLLAIAKEHIHDGRQTCLVARLFSSVAQNKVNVHYGEEHSRLSRDQSICNQDIAPSDQSGLLSAVTFGVSRDYTSRLNSLFVDRLVYVTEWQSFLRDCQADWKHYAKVTFAFLVLHLFSPHGGLGPQPILTAASFSLFLAGLVTSVLLLFRYRGMEKSISADGLQYLTAIHSDRHGFKFSALLFSLPSALSIWGAAVFVLNGVCLIMVSLGLFVGLVFFSVVLAALVGFMKATDVQYFPRFSLYSMRSLRKKDDYDLV